MNTIANQEFSGERPLYAAADTRLENVTIHLGESSLKHCKNIEAENCRFEGKYVFWECDHVVAEHCEFPESCRSSMWYTRDITLRHCQVQAPKMFRRASGVVLEDVQFPNAQEMFWDCDHLTLRKVSLTGADYAYMHTDNVNIEDYHQDGNYSFQQAKRVHIKNAVLNSKDAFWESEDVILEDCEINGEFLGWYSKGMTLVRCRITGTQPLCYCEDLCMVDCMLGDDCDRPFEYSTVNGQYTGQVGRWNPETKTYEI